MAAIDQYRQFYDDRIDVAGPEMFVQANILYSEYLKWYPHNFPHNQIPSFDLFRQEMIERWGLPQNNAWYGIQLR